ncbi:MAG: hypothetical protein V1867_04620 [Candidatus Falkowbacteria bacterium]
MSNQLQKAIKLAKKTGDRLIIFDSGKTDNAYVVMSLDEYEKLIVGGSEVRGLTEDELLDKINRDIAIWKSEQDFDDYKQRNSYGRDIRGVEEYKRSYRKDGYAPKPDYSRLEEDQDRKVSYPATENEQEKSADVYGKKRHWMIPRERKEGAEEIIEEDRQYLEDVDNF